MASEQTHVKGKRLTGFLDLPAELRNNIYEFAFAMSKGRPVPPDSRDGVSKPEQSRLGLAAMRQTCRQIRKDVTPMFFAHARFRMDLMEFSSFIKSASANEIECLRKIVIDDTKPLQLQWPEVGSKEWARFHSVRDVFQRTRTAISETVVMHGKGKLRWSAIKVRLPVYWPETHTLEQYNYCQYGHTLCGACYQWKDWDLDEVDQWRVVRGSNGAWRIEKSLNRARRRYTRWGMEYDD